MSGTALSELQDDLAQYYLEHGPDALWVSLQEDTGLERCMELLMVNIIQRAHDLEQA